MGEAEAAGEEAPVVSNARHVGLLERAVEGVEAGLHAFVDRLSGDLVMVDIREALGALDEILGRRFDEQVLDTIFARFCLGK
jgi:tRNA modification GTPase